jgi:glycosyltransferase involved in cell wall biosynthesis
VISVVIPAWNAARTLPETLASIAAQTRRPAEVIVVDDGSTDATGAIARAAGSRVLRIDHAGFAAAMNAGIAASHGSLIAFLDSDDLWTPDKLALQEATLTADPLADGVFGHFRCFADPLLNGALRVPEGARPGWLQGAALLRRERLLSVGPFDPTIGNGAFIQWADRARHLGLRLVMRPETVLLRRIRRGSMSNPSPERNAGYVRAARDAIRRRRALPAPAAAD